MKTFSMLLLIGLFFTTTSFSDSTTTTGKMFYFVYSSCENCNPKHGEAGKDFFISEVINADSNDAGSTTTPFFDQMVKNFDWAAPNGNLSEGYLTKEEADTERTKMINSKKTSHRVHYVKW